MSDSTRSTHISKVELPTSAPQVRVTAGLGSAAQKTWNLRRPVTLIGSRRPAHIVLHDGDLSAAHCVIINTGTEVLLKDLHTRGGTVCNNTDIDQVVLKDGDVVTVGASTIQVAIRVPADTSEDSGCGLEYADPLTFRTPVKIGLIHTDQEWELIEAVTLVGRHDAAAIRLDHQDVSRRHAIIFRFKDGPAVFDVGGQGGVLVNGQQCSLAPLSNGDRVGVGPFGLQVDSGGAVRLDVQHQQHDATGTPAGVSNTVDLPSNGTGSTGVPAVGNSSDLSELDGTQAVGSALDSIQSDISESWEQINTVQVDLLDGATSLNKQDADLATREATADARDAALRGQLHDVERFQEHLVEREREIAGQFALLQKEKDSLAEDQTACAQREEQVAKRIADLSRREHVFAQRWTRLVTAKCPHCGQPVSNGKSGPS